MRVAIDGRTLQGPRGGVGRAVANLLPALAAGADVTLLLDARLGPAAAAVPAAIETRYLRAWLPSGAAWLQLAVPSHLRGFDGVFHCPFYGLPYRQPVPMVVTIHDLSFEHHAQWLSRGKRAVFRAQARHAARTARLVITDSEAIRREVIQRYGVPDDRVRAVPLGVDPSFGPPDPQALARRLTSLGLERPYVVALGGAPRRNLPVAIAAMRLVRRAGLAHDLVVVGSEPAPPEPGLLHLGPVDDATLAQVLAGADVLCYPTEYEGFGMPAAEALACGTGIVCAAVGSLPELVGDAAEWAAGTDTEAVAAALLRALGEPAAVQRLRVAARSAALRLPTWSEVANAHLRAYADAAEERSTG